MKLANKEEKERLQSNVRLHNGKSTACRIQVESQDHGCGIQQLTDMRGDGFDGVRVQLLHLIEFHNTIGDVMSTARQERAAERLRDAEADQVEADQRFLCYLCVTATVRKEPKPKQEEQQSTVPHGHRVYSPRLRGAGRSQVRVRYCEQALRDP
ncbi:hypothetical protein PI124_g11726 [Phytophthora idaei]|nr:hypothetical protein PI124_g11726 [Phytophthora idaei]